jgi:lipopolysaccharide/colanic/teichoic acid biosynthesis glycosyltransferase
MRERGFGVHSTILFDEGTAGTHLFHRLDLFPEFGYEITAVVTFNGLMLPKDRYSTINVIHLDSMAEMKEHILANSVDRVIVPTVESHKTVVSEILTVCKETGAKLTLLSKESEELLRFSYINDVAGITLYSARRRKIDAARRIAKRAFDFVGSILAIVLFSPVIGFTALAILAEDGLPIFYRQKRALARGRKELEILKFRTMVKDAETQQANLYEKNETSGGLFMLREDPRILKVGRFLRKLSLDELPQLFNVLFGEMSLVGPRPLSIADLNNISVENTLRGYYELRANAIPGMTGLWQISGRRELSFKEMVLLDLYYIDNQSVMFDVEILLATVPVVLFGKGGY